VGPVALEGRPITDQTIADLSRRSDVDQVLPIEPIRFPVRAEGSIFGNLISTDVVIHGVPRELVADALAEGQTWSRQPIAPDTWPVVISRYWLDLYNLGMARAGGLPLLSPGFATGKEFDLYLGESTIGLARTEEPVRRMSLRVVGLSSQPGLLGMALPPDLVRGLNQLYAPGQKPHYVQLVVDLAQGADRDTFLAAAAELGLQPSQEDILGGRIKTAVGVMGWILIGLAVAVFVLGILTFYLLFAMLFHARRIDLVCLRALGLTPGQAVALALCEVGVLAAGALVVAMGLNAFASRALGRLAQPWLERLSSLPADLFATSPLWLTLAAGLIFAASLLPALAMLRWVVRVEPGQVIRDL
jgi:hypothetical protein